MYKAKERRSNAVEFFSGEMSAALDRRISMTNALRQALVRSEIFLEFQPVVDLASKKPVGFETLVRWRHPEKGLLLPGEFIDHAESTGLIGSLGTWVLREACREAVRWKGGGIFLSVNISGRQLQDTSFPDLLRTVLRETGLPPERLELEFSESVFFLKDVGGILSELRKIGVRLIIDDFGKGFSSLGYLRRFPVDRIKIDREFVAEIGRDPRATAIVRTILSLAKDLGLSAIGEGAESADQVAFLRENGCSLAQGFLFSRPLSAGSLPPFFEKDFLFSSLELP
jgi:EAL domain-containing protein (putative c-di-GMP-specific phosphodiesterase class I)